MEFRKKHVHQMHASAWDLSGSGRGLSMIRRPAAGLNFGTVTPALALRSRNPSQPAFGPAGASVGVVVPRRRAPSSHRLPLHETHSTHGHSFLFCSLGMVFNCINSPLLSSELMSAALTTQAFGKIIISPRILDGVGGYVGQPNSGSCLA